MAARQSSPPFAEDGGSIDAKPHARPYPEAFAHAHAKAYYQADAHPHSCPVGGTPPAAVAAAHARPQHLAFVVPLARAHTQADTPQSLAHAEAGDLHGYAVEHSQPERAHASAQPRAHAAAAGAHAPGQDLRRRTRSSGAAV